MKRKFLIVIIILTLIILSVKVTIKNDTINLYEDISILSKTKFDSAILTSVNENNELETINDLYNPEEIDKLVNMIINFKLIKIGKKDLTNEYKYCVFLVNAKENNSNVSNIVLYFYIDNNLKIFVNTNENTKEYFFKINENYNIKTIHELFI